ncbi:MAG: hypothetical protein IKD29_05505 [Lentisphaeria bacterium]|nr:hypothetical protein [Lentisphaeria bacterium]
MKIFFVFSMLCALMISGCQSRVEKVEKMKSHLGAVDRQTFPEVEGAKLELAVSGTPELIAGKDKKITFILRNLNNTPVSIPEWFTNEADNIEVSCQIWFPQQTGPEEDRWVTYTVVPKRPVMRYPLKLGAKMFVSVDVPIPFLEHLIVKPGTERRYFIKARLNLRSVSAESKISAITVRPSAPARAKKK